MDAASGGMTSLRLSPLLILLCGSSALARENHSVPVELRSGKAAGLANAFLTHHAPRLIDHASLTARDRAARLEPQIAWLGRQPVQMQVKPGVGAGHMVRGMTKNRQRLLHHAKWYAKRQVHLQQAADLVAQNPAAQKALAGLLTRRAVPQELLARVLSNRYLTADVASFLSKLARAAHLSGVESAIHRIAQSNKPSNMRGARFEVEIAPKLPRITAVSSMVLGHECDAVLAPGANGRRTLVAMHTVSPVAADKMKHHLQNMIRGELDELAIRTRGHVDSSTGKPFDAMMVMGLPPGTRVPRSDWKRLEARLGTNLTVVVANTKTNRLRKVYGSGR